MTNDVREAMPFLQEADMTDNMETPLGALARRRELSIIQNLLDMDSPSDIVSTVDAMCNEYKDNIIVVRGFMVASNDIGRILENRLKSIEKSENKTSCDIVNDGGVQFRYDELGQFAKRREQFILRRVSHGKFNFHEMFGDGDDYEKPTEEDIIAYQVAVDDLIIRGFITFEKLYYFITAIGKKYLRIMDAFETD